MWTRRLMRTAFIFIVVITMLPQELDADIGTAWIQIHDGTTMGYVNALEAGEHRLYAGTRNGIFISQDHGHTWHTTSFKEDCSTITINGNSVYAGTAYQGVFRSDDAGKTWKPIRDGLRFEDLNGKRFYGEVRRILVTRDKIINVMYHRGTYTSTDWGERWHDVSEEWLRGNSIYSMTEFNGYLWSAISTMEMGRSPDTGQTWESLPFFERDRVNDWEVLNNRLYVAGQEGIGRWNEKAQIWEYLMEGLPTGSSLDLDEPPWMYNLAVLGGCLFAGLRRHGVYVFDALTETWSSVGLDGLSVSALLSYKSSLYAGTATNGIYCAGILRVQPHAKAVTTWARVKQRALAKE